MIDQLDPSHWNSYANSELCLSTLRFDSPFGRCFAKELSTRSAQAIALPESIPSQRVKTLLTCLSQSIESISQFASTEMSLYKSERNAYQAYWLLLEQSSVFCAIEAKLITQKAAADVQQLQLEMVFAGLSLRLLNFFEQARATLTQVINDVDIKTAWTSLFDYTAKILKSGQVKLSRDSTTLLPKLSAQLTCIDLILAEIEEFKQSKQQTHKQQLKSVNLLRKEVTQKILLPGQTVAAHGSDSEQDSVSSQNGMIRDVQQSAEFPMMRMQQVSFAAPTTSGGVLLNNNKMILMPPIGSRTISVIYKGGDGQYDSQKHLDIFKEQIESENSFDLYGGSSDAVIEKAKSAAQSHSNTNRNSQSSNSSNGVGSSSGTNSRRLEMEQSKAKEIDLRELKSIEGLGTSSRLMEIRDSANIRNREFSFKNEESAAAAAAANEENNRGVKKNSLKTIHEIEELVKTRIASLNSQLTKFVQASEKSQLIQQGNNINVNHNSILMPSIDGGGTGSSTGGLTTVMTVSELPMIQLSDQKLFSRVKSLSTARKDSVSSSGAPGILAGGVFSGKDSRKSLLSNAIAHLAQDEDDENDEQEPDSDDDQSQSNNDEDDDESMSRGTGNSEDDFNGIGRQNIRSRSHVQMDRDHHLLHQLGFESEQSISNDGGNSTAGGGGEIPAALAARIRASVRLPMMHNMSDDMEESDRGSDTSNAADESEITSGNYSILDASQLQQQQQFHRKKRSRYVSEDLIDEGDAESLLSQSQQLQNQQQAYRSRRYTENDWVAGSGGSGSGGGGFYGSEGSDENHGNGNRFAMKKRRKRRIGLLSEKDVDEIRQMVQDDMEKTRDAPVKLESKLLGQGIATSFTKYSFPLVFKNKNAEQVNQIKEKYRLLSNYQHLIEVTSQSFVSTEMMKGKSREPKMTAVQNNIAFLNMMGRLLPASKQWMQVQAEQMGKARMARRSTKRMSKKSMRSIIEMNESVSVSSNGEGKKGDDITENSDSADDSDSKSEESEETSEESEEWMDDEEYADTSSEHSEYVIEDHMFYFVEQAQDSVFNRFDAFVEQYVADEAKRLASIDESSSNGEGRKEEENTAAGVAVYSLMQELIEQVSVPIPKSAKDLPFQWVENQRAAMGFTVGKVKPIKFMRGSETDDDTSSVGSSTRKTRLGSAAGQIQSSNSLIISPNAAANSRRKLRKKSGSYHVDSMSQSVRL